MEVPSNDEAKWLDILDKEFDKECRCMQMRLKSEEMKAKKDLLLFESGLSALTGLFSQLVLKTKTVLQTSNRLKASQEGTQAKLTQVLTSYGKLQRELQARRLEVRSLQVQLSKEPDKEKELCALRTELELELERYSQGEAREEQLNAELSVSRELNTTLLRCVSSLHSGLAETTLIAKCTESELTGRIQQLQLLLSGLRGPELQKLWTQIMAEIAVHRQRAILRAYCSRPKSLLSDPYKFLGEAHKMRVNELQQVLLGCSPNTAAGATLVLGKRRRVRSVTLTRRTGEQLGISIVGGAELGVPILISGLEEDKVAYMCGELQIGDAILSVNGESLQGRTHEDVVALVGTENTVVLEVMFAVGVLELIPKKERRTSIPEGEMGPSITEGHIKSADVDVQRVVGARPGHQTAGSHKSSDTDAQTVREQAEHRDTALHGPSAEEVARGDVPTPSTTAPEAPLQSSPSVDNTQMLSSAFGLEHSIALGFVPKDLDALSLEPTLFYYDQDAALQVRPAAPESSKVSETELQSYAQFNTFPDCSQSLTSPLCPTTPLYQTTILSVQSLNSTDDSDAPLFSLTL